MDIELLKEYVMLTLIAENLSDNIRVAFAKLPKDGTVFFHFSDLNKLGINTRSEYETPLGICGYPLTEETKNDYFTDKLPFAADRKFIHFFAPRNPDACIILQDLTWSSANDLYSKIVRKNDGDVLDYLTDDEFRETATDANVNTPGGVLWYHMWNNIMTSPRQWSKLFMNVGLEGVIDKGDGIIHENERQQGLFFSGAFVDQVMTVDNVPAAARRKRLLKQLYPILRKASLEYMDAGRKEETESKRAKIIDDLRKKLGQIEGMTKKLAFYLEDKNEKELVWIIANFDRQWSTQNDFMKDFANQV